MNQQLLLAKSFSDEVVVFVNSVFYVRGWIRVEYVTMFINQIFVIGILL